LLLNQIQERKKKEKINKRTTKFISRIKKPSCPWNRDIIVWERWEMGEDNGRRKEKNVLWSCERERGNKIGERVGEWILLIKIGEYFHSPKLFGKSGKSAGSDFLVFLLNWLTKIAKKLFWWGY
jgi:hypothetical protein